MSAPDIFKNLSDFGQVLYIKMLLTKGGYAMRLIRSQFSNRPHISNMTNWKTIYSLKGEAEANTVYIYGSEDAIDTREEGRLIKREATLWA